MKKYYLSLDNVIDLDDIQFNLDKRGEHYQNCTECNVRLRTITNYAGSGSHYWHLQCLNCEREYTYDTYRFQLEAKNDE